MRQEQIKNNSQSQLNGAINNSVTSLTLVSGSSFPASGNFRIRIDDEIMLCTARSGNDLTVVRGIEGTSAASHSNGVTVRGILTAGALEQYVRESNPQSGLVPLAAIRSDSDATLVAADFSWVNQGTGTLTDSNGGIVLSKGSQSSTNYTSAVRSAPSAPYAYVMGIQSLVWQGGAAAGVCLRESSTNEWYVLQVRFPAGGTPLLEVRTMTANTGGTQVVKASAALALISPVLFLRLEDNNTNVIFSASHDGVNWTQLYTESRTALMAGGPDQIGFHVNNDSSGGVVNSVRLCHWSKE